MIFHFNAIANSIADKGYAIADQFLSQKEAKDILSLPEFQETTSFKKAGIGKKQDLLVNETIRGDYIRWLDPESASPSIKVFLNRLKDLLGFLNQELFLSLKDLEVHQTIYPAGSFYKRHLDQFRFDDHRKLSVICYLNEDWKEENGGQLRMFLPDETIDVLPVIGRLVCFRSDKIEHEVLPATRPRLSLTGWLLDQYATLRHLS
jgi:SM-20-related protein